MKPAIPQRLRDLAPYQPGKPIEEVQRELGLTDVVKLASNENALGPSPAGLAAARAALANVHRYPEGGAVVLARRLADGLGVEPSQLIFGTGSNEVIDLLVRTFAGSGEAAREEVVFSADAFVVYSIIAHAVGAVAVAVAADGFHHDLDAIADALGERTRLVFLANPNNPTGTAFDRETWRRFLARVPEHVVVVVDQAYFEYVDDPNYPLVLDELDAHPNLVVLRTFSKIHGLAGLRIGYGIGSSEIIGGLARMRQPFNVNSIAQAAALAALDDVEHLERSRALVREGRRYYAEQLDRLGLPWVPSQANFVLVEVGAGAAVCRAMLSRGVIVRPMDGYGMNAHVRITFGTEAENLRCISALEAALAESR
jgi:histidinol-phosphate aminotransferase